MANVTQYNIYNNKCLAIECFFVVVVVAVTGTPYR